MSKLQSTNIKDYLINKISIRFNRPAKEIEAIVNHQIQGLNKAIQADNVFSVELSGFGKWIFNHKKAQKKYEKNLSKEKLFITLSEKEGMTEKQIASYKLKLENTRKWMESIKPKLDKCPSLQNISN